MDKQAGGGNITTVAPITNNQTNVSNTTNQGQSRRADRIDRTGDALSGSSYRDHRFDN